MHRIPHVGQISTPHPLNSILVYHSSKLFTMNGLLVMGGESSRMKQDKAFLEWKGKPLYENGYNILSQVCGKVMLSIKPSQRATLLQNTGLTESQFLYDKAEYRNKGPCAALLTAYEADPEATWVVLAVDFPHINTESVAQLMSSYQAPITCYIHPEDDNPEPMFSIWSPDALETLRWNVIHRKKTGPCYSIRKLVGNPHPANVSNYILPDNPQWLLSTNTPKEWQEAFNLI